MTLPTGQISMSQVNTELGYSSTATISLNDSAVRTLAGVPSGTISLANLQGKSNAYPATTYTYDGSYAVVTATAQGQTNLTSLALVGAKITRLDIVCFGAGGAGSRWPTGAAGGYGGAGYRVTFTNRSFLDSISSLYVMPGDGGMGYNYGGTYRFPDNRQAGGAGGGSIVKLNGSSGTTLIASPGGYGSRAIYAPSFTSASFGGSYDSTQGGLGGNGAPEGYNNSGSSSTYGGGGGGAHPSGVPGNSTYAGRGGYGTTYYGYNSNACLLPGGGDGGWDTSNYNRGAPGRVVIYINNGGAVPF